jgi:hypothetical protein
MRNSIPGRQSRTSHRNAIANIIAVIVIIWVIVAGPA